jgi:hypothetical protein
MKLVSIGTRKVPVRLGNGLSEIRFTAGVHGKKEAGIYRFWTCVGEDEYGGFTIIGRAKSNLDAGDRIARMSMQRTKDNPPDHRKVYAIAYKLAQEHAHYVRPSTEREISRWIQSHPEDMEFAMPNCMIRGKRYKKFPKVPW